MSPLMRRSKDTRLASLSAKQHGVVARGQMTTLGFSSGEIANRLRNGELIRILPAVYRVAGAPASWEGLLTASLLWAGPDAFLSHRAAARLWGLPVGEFELAELTVPRNLRCRNPWVRTHIGNIEPPDAARIRGLKVTRVARTLVDLGAVLKPSELEAALEDALRRRLTNLKEVRSRIEERTARGREGPPQLAEALAHRGEDLAAADSVFESRVFRLIRDAGFPLPKRQFPVAVADGRVFSIDLAYPHERVGIECHSFKFHSGRGSWASDVQRENLLKEQGWHLLHAVWEDLDNPTQFLRILSRALEGARADKDSAAGELAGRSLERAIR